MSNDGIIAKIEALLAKAAGTEFEQEAEAFYAKAQELMIRHAVDEQMLAQASGSRTTEKPVGERFMYSANDANVPGKKQILGSVARNNRCKVLFYVGSKKEQMCTIVGFADDVTFVKMLYANLIVQAGRESRAARLSKADTTAFMLGFAQVIERRMKEVNTTVTNSGGTSMTLALRDRSAVVKDVFSEMFPRTRASRTRTSGSEHAMLSGRAAGERADISGGRRNLGTTRALGR